MDYNIYMFFRLSLFFEQNDFGGFMCSNYTSSNFRFDPVNPFASFQSKTIFLNIPISFLEIKDNSIRPIQT